MPFKTYADQVLDHITFLRSRSFNIEELKVDSDFVRCHQTDDSQGRGELCYKTTSKLLANGLVGLGTWCRVGGETFSFQTYGLPLGGPAPATEPSLPVTPIAAGDNSASHEEAARRAYGFWEHSSLQGESDYLTRKGVGAYGIRFRSGAQYGNVAVVPMRDIDGRLWSYQLLNPDGSKRFPKGARIQGLFHFLQPIVKGKLIGVAEAYVTAATLFEVTSLPIACCFGCNNLLSVSVALSKRYPNSQIIIFSDNDRHLLENKGLLKALEAQQAIGSRAFVAVPEFGDISPGKEASDWNDLFRLKGQGEVKAQLSKVFVGKALC